MVNNIAYYIKFLHIPNPHFPIFQDKNQGCWKPNGEFGECGKRVDSANIVGGKRAKPGDFPYMALIGYGTTTNQKGETVTSYNCGGSLINKYYVLTAAHCMFNSIGRDDPVLPR